MKLVNYDVTEDRLKIQNFDRCCVSLTKQEAKEVFEELGNILGENSPDLVKLKRKLEDVYDDLGYIVDNITGECIP